MPEYLSPGVYVEEPEVGVRPIEGVSTSTTGMVGVTERGPTNVPILVTSFAQFRRDFGGYLDVGVYGDHGYLPHAAEGFFTNGGSRLFVVRVVADQAGAGLVATFAGMRMFNGGAAGVDDSLLLAGVRAGDALLLIEDAAGLAPNQTVRLDSGSAAEYLTVQAAPIAPNTRMLAISAAMYGTYAAGSTVAVAAIAPVQAGAVNVYDTMLTAAANAGATTILPIAAPAAPGDLIAGHLLQIGAGDSIEILAVADVASDAGGTRITLAAPLGRSHLAGEQVLRVEDLSGGATEALLNQAGAGDALLTVDNAAATFGGAAWVSIDDGFGQIEYHQPHDFHPLGLDFALATARAEHSSVTQVTGIPAAVAPNDHLTVLTNGANAGDTAIAVAAPGSLAAGEFVRLEAAGSPNEEAVQIAGVNGNVLTLAAPLVHGHAGGIDVERIAPAFGAGVELLQAASAGDTTLFLSSNAVIAAGMLVMVGDAAAANVELRNTVATPGLQVVPLTAPLGANHVRGAVFGRRDPVLAVEALDEGPWGDELRVIAMPDARAVTTVSANTAAGLPIPLTSTRGIQVGTVLDFGGRLAKVEAVQGATVQIVPQGPAFGVSVGDPVITREFQLRVEWVRDGVVIEDETLRQLSLDRRHPNYVETVVGTNEPARRQLHPATRRPLGRSRYIRVTDLNHATSEATIRSGLDLLEEIGFGGRRRATGLFLTGGTNPPAGIVAQTVIGADAVDPAGRTGLQTLRSENRISLVAAPGVTDPDVQQAVIDHCEAMLYRFAVLDSIPGANPREGAALAEVIAQRNLYDSRYAALYYPWYVVRDPHAEPDALDDSLTIPPSGHVLGLIARTDNDRGVHKAPANVVIRGIRSLQRKVQKGEHDLLNPDPTNICASRDFRSEGRGLRVFGARCITSDRQWRYINVRRLFLFLEQSIEEGTQWVTFEPNAEPLWARVRQSISIFLTRVWRDGALEGLSPAEAFFVKCDRETMTEDDIQNGRLIVLVGVAPVKPAEFVIIRIFQTTREALMA